MIRLKTKIKADNEIGTKELREPDFVLTSLWEKIPYHIKVTFAAAFAFFLLIHMFALTNKFLNHDEIRYNFVLLHMLRSGRWFSHVMTILRSTFSMPWLIGVFAAIFLATSTCFIVACFRIKKIVHCLLTALIVVSFPSVTATLSYMVAVDVYYLSFLMVCVGVYIANKFKYGFFASIILFTLSLGIYQAYLPIGAGIMVGILIIDILEQKSFKPTVIKTVKFLVALGISFILYFIIVDLTTDTLRAGMGMDQMGRIPLSRFPRLIYYAYANAFLFIFGNSHQVHNVVTQYAFVAIAVSIVFIVLLNMPQVFRGDKKQFVFFLLLLMILPLAANSVELMNAEWVSMIMNYGLIILPIFVMAIAGNHSIPPPPALTSLKPFQKQIKLGLLASNWLIVIGLLLTGFNYTVIANQSHLRMHHVYEQGFAFSNRLIMRIESLDGFTGEEQIIIFGQPSIEQPFNEMIRVPELEHMTGVLAFLPAQVNMYTRFLSHYLAVGHTITHRHRQDGSTWDWLGERGVFSDVFKMPVYPAYGSVVRFDDQTILVRLGDGEPTGNFAAQNLFPLFLDNAFSEDNIIILSVRDEASNSLDEIMQDALHSLGLLESLTDKFRYSYAAIIDGRNVVFEAISSDSIEHSYSIGGLSIEILSAGFEAGDISSILIDGEEYSLNNRGLNIVVVDKDTGTVIDSVSFDMNDEGRTFQRR